MYVPAKINYREFFNEYDMKLADNFDDLTSFFNKENQKLEQGNQKDILTAVINAFS